MLIMLTDVDVVVNDRRGTVKLSWSWCSNASFRRCSATTRSSPPTTSAPAITLSVLSEVGDRSVIVEHSYPVNFLNTPPHPGDWCGWGDSTAVIGLNHSYFLISHHSSKKRPGLRIQIKAGSEGGAENARLENARLEVSAPCYRGWKMRDWKIREREKYGTPHVA